MPAAAGSPSRAARVFAWSGALMFCASLSFFLFTYAVTFDETGATDSAGGRAVAVNVALFTIFALHHSVFARTRLRDWVSRLSGPALERAWYVWIASVMLVAVCALWQPVPGVLWNAGDIWRWALVAAQIAGLVLSVASAAMIDVFELSGVRQLAPSAHDVEFKTSGPYGWMRHPIYTGWFLMVFCAPNMTMTRFVFAVVSSVYLLVAIPFEERSLVASSEGAYERYTRQVKWKLVPGVY